MRRVNGAEPWHDAKTPFLGSAPLARRLLSH